MKTKNEAAASKKLEHEAEGGVTGAIAGALLGAVAGPPGAVAGAVLGAVAGALTGAAASDETLAEDERATLIDARIGVSGGDMGTNQVKHPPAKIGAYSAGAAGVSGPAEESPAEGPAQPPES